MIFIKTPQDSADRLLQKTRKMYASRAKLISNRILVGLVFRKNVHTYCTPTIQFIVCPRCKKHCRHHQRNYKLANINLDKHGLSWARTPIAERQVSISERITVTHIHQIWNGFIHSFSANFYFFSRLNVLDKFWLLASPFFCIQIRIVPGKG